MVWVFRPHIDPGGPVVNVQVVPRRPRHRSRLVCPCDTVPPLFTSTLPLGSVSGGTLLLHPPLPTCPLPTRTPVRDGGILHTGRSMTENRWDPPYSSRRVRLGPDPFVLYGATSPLLCPLLRCGHTRVDGRDPVPDSSHLTLRPSSSSILLPHWGSVSGQQVHVDKSPVKGTKHHPSRKYTYAKDEREIRRTP